MGGGAGQVTHEVGHDHDRALEDTDEEHLLVAVVLPDLGGQLGQPCLDLLLGDEHLDEVVLDVLGVHGSP
ncbi:metal-dependent hydrolase of the beta-lactamase superfamily I [Janibacter hoylei PVAS-1]|uniref:Metal-dependent hydrolase of the beta-lactamase superfamily I n=1 Tax=Janibacter hoylei PVAS-1 TaxID=1210046 RepID=K1DZQ1_9MICO|nr:metal-dependent hydrolase of the beta-lactamase superfamily I [Janibacter hoylei PVAS-1]